jgi:hydroxymethylglutaryl-CoA synthase
MNPVRILAVGTSAPALRLPVDAIQTAWDRKGGRGHVAVCAADEDALTLAWDAAVRAIRASGVDPEAIDGLWWGTSNPPFADGPSHAVLANALSVGPAGALLSGSTHSGIEAFLAAADAIAAGSVATAVIVASDALRAGPGTGFEGRAGAGAAAFVMSATAGTATISTRATTSRPLLDRYRGMGELDERDLYDTRLFREEIFLPIVESTIDAILLDGPVNRWSLPDPDGRLGSVVAKRAAAAELASAGPYAAVGDAGAAIALLGLASALASTGRAVAVAYGGGRATAVRVDVTAPVPGADATNGSLDGGRVISYHKALRVRGQVVAGGETIPMGVPPESALFARGAEEMLQLLGGRCHDCGTISTPPSIHPHCVACGGPKLEPVQLARSGRVHTFVVNYTMPAPFEAPLPIAVIDLDDGARVMLQVDDDGSQVAIDTPVELILRKYAHERGVPVYGYKARPITPARGAQ